MLTRSQQKTLHFIKQFYADKSYAPTSAEIADGIGISSRGVVHRYLKALAAAGYIHLTPKRHRNITLIDNPLANLAIPLLGQIAAGQPIEAIEQKEAIDITSVFTGPNRYALRVKGDSMIDEGIFDGDIVVCEKADSAHNGQIVVALVDQQEATLKRFKRVNAETVELIPANSSMQPMVYPASRVCIQGLYLGLLRIGS